MLKDEYKHGPKRQSPSQTQFYNKKNIFLCSFAYELKLCVIYDLTTFAIKKLT